MKICYEYKIEKVAFIFDGKDNQPVGIVEDDQRNGDVVKATVKLFKHLPKELVDLLTENPQVLNFREVKRKADQVVVLPEAADSLIIP